MRAPPGAVTFLVTDANMENIMNGWIGKSGYDTCLQAGGEQLQAHGTEVHLIRFREGKFTHFHKTTTEFFHFTSGSGRLVLSDREIPLYPGVSIVIQPYEVHTFINDSAEKLLEAVMVKTNTHPQDTFVALRRDL